MKINLRLPGRYWIPGLIIIILMAGCAPSTLSAHDATQMQTATATPDPLYTLHCIHQSGRNDFCYVSEVLAGNNELLEKTTITFCNNKEDIGCSILIWRNEESVAQAIPLTDAEKASRLARFSRDPNSGNDCFQVYNNGEVTYSSGRCR
jgi:hypothetical protein